MKKRSVLAIKKLYQVLDQMCIPCATTPNFIYNIKHADSL